jgi:hypothetical protein
MLIFFVKKKIVGEKEIACTITFSAGGAKTG